MQVTVSRQALLKELNFIQGVVERKNTIPILSNLLLETEDGALSIKGTDLDVSITTVCDAGGQRQRSNLCPGQEAF